MEQDEFRQLAMAEMDALYRMAYHLSRHPQQAEDFVQETYLRAFKAGQTFKLADYGIRPWLFKILHNVINSHLSHDQRDRSALDGLQHEPGPSQEAEEPPVSDLSQLNWEEVDERLKAAIDNLPLSHRSVFLMCVVEGLRYREVADVLGVPIGTVMSRLYRAKAILAAGLTDLAAERRIGGEETKNPPDVPPGKMTSSSEE